MMLTTSPRPTLLTLLPGITRKRLPHVYQFRRTFTRSPGDDTTCLATWDVLGGREPYQIASEQTSNGDVLWQCTCADAVYRGKTPYYRCKHVRGLLELANELALPTPQAKQPA